MDSSSATSPFSRRCTIDSNSASAFSKGRLATSAWVSFSFAILSALHQRADMGGDGFRKPFEIVAALQHRDDAALGVLVGERHQLLRDPGIIGLQEIEIGEGVARMRVEARGDHDEVGMERIQPWADRDIEGLAKLPAAIAGRE